MGAEERRGDVHGLLSGEFLVQAKNLEFARNIKAIAALGLDRGGAISGELFERMMSAFFQGIGCGRA